MLLFNNEYIQFIYRDEVDKSMIILETAFFNKHEYIIITVNQSNRFNLSNILSKVHDNHIKITLKLDSLSIH